MSDSKLREQFESQANDSYGFKKSRRGTYVNTSVARDWKWFRQGAKAGDAEALAEKDAVIAQLARFISNNRRYNHKDWACKSCAPEGEHLIPGFVCGQCRALAIVEVIGEEHDH